MMLRHKTNLPHWTTSLGVGILGHRPVDGGQDDARYDCSTAARGHGAPHRGRGRTPALGCADGHAPLSAVPGTGGTQPSPRRGLGRALARAHRLARRGVQAQGPGPVDRVASRAAVSPPAPHCQQREVRDPARVLGAEPGLSGPGVECSPAERRHACGARTVGPACRDLRGPKPVHRRVLPGGELAGAGANPGLCPQARHARDLGPARETEGGPGLPAGARCARAASRLGRRAGVAKPGRPRAVDDEPAAKPVRVSSHRTRVPRHTRAALPVGHDPGHRGGREARRIPWHQSVRGVCQHIDPAPASRPSSLLQPPSGTFHRAHHDRVLQRPGRARPRCAGPRRTHLGRAAKPRQRTGGHRRQAHPRRRPPQPRRQPPPRRSRGASLREGARAGSVSLARATRSRPFGP